MKQMIFFIILALSYISANADTLPNNNVTTVQYHQQVQQNVEKTVSNEKQEDVSSLTLAVNAINNLLTWSEKAIAYLTLIVALFGFFGYYKINKSLKDNMKKNDKIIEDKIEEINNRETEFNDYISRTKAIIEKLNGQEKYMYKTNQYLYEALDKIANQISDTKIGNSILKEMYHNYQVTNLYSVDDNTKFAAFAYIQENGNFNDIEHLEYISNYDSNERYMVWAKAIIVIIRHKINN